MQMVLITIRYSVYTCACKWYPIYPLLLLLPQKEPLSLDNGEDMSVCVHVPVEDPHEDDAAMISNTGKS